MDAKLIVKSGQLYYENKLIGETRYKHGFEKYIFDEKPLGSGASGVTFSVTHKFLQVKQVIKIYLPKVDESSTSKKALEEAKKNSNTMLSSVSAVVFDAGEYNYPVKLRYSIMESVNSFCTIKQWREKRDLYFKYDVHENLNDYVWRSVVHTSLNLSAGFLKSVIVLYENNIVHGDLNPGNILWIMNESNVDKELKKLASFCNSDIGYLMPYPVKLIDMGVSKASDCEEAGSFRDAWKIYEHMKSFLSPILRIKNVRFETWCDFEFIDCKYLLPYGVKKIFVKEVDGKRYKIAPETLAGDFFRLICVLTIALGIITNWDLNIATSDDLPILDLTSEDNNDFYALMHQAVIDKAIEAFSFDSMYVLSKLNKINSAGTCINWECVWNTYPFKMINAESILKDNE